MGFWPLWDRLLIRIEVLRRSRSVWDRLTSRFTPLVLTEQQAARGCRIHFGCRLRLFLVADLPGGSSPPGELATTKPKKRLSLGLPDETRTIRVADRRSIQSKTVSLRGSLPG